jgi:hypothetical protein
MKFSGYYSIAVGLLMIGQWAFFLSVGAVVELQTEPIRIAFHLAGELLTAASLIAGGVGLLRGTAWGKWLSLTAAGMLAYTVVVSPGYFAQSGQWPLVGMFAVLLALEVLNIYCLARVENRLEA